MRSLFSYTSPSIAACHSKTEVSNGTGRGKADCIELMVAYTCIWYGQSSLKALNWSQMLCGPTQMLPTRREGQWNLKQYLLLDKPNSNHRKTCFKLPLPHPRCLCEEHCRRKTWFSTSTKITSHYTHSHCLNWGKRFFNIQSFSATKYCGEHFEKRQRKEGKSKDAWLLMHGRRVSHSKRSKLGRC